MKNEKNKEEKNKKYKISKRRSLDTGRFLHRKFIAYGLLSPAKMAVDGGSQTPIIGKNLLIFKK